MYLISREVDEWPPDFRQQEYPDIHSLQQLLHVTHQYSTAFLAGLTDDLARPLQMPWGVELPLDWCIWHVIEHEIHHRGELSLILGLLGREAPDV